MLRLSKQKRARLTHEKKAKIREKEMKNLPIIKIFNVYTHQCNTKLKQDITQTLVFLIAQNLNLKTFLFNNPCLGTRR